MNVRRIALVGQPNSGKSTLFNALVGWRAVASNFPGTTVEVLRGRANLAGRPAEVVDLPGIYSLAAQDPAERVARDFLLGEQVDLIVNVVDASLLSRSLSLTLELAELGIPMVVCLNMADEAEHKGIRIEREKLAELLGVPAVATVAARGVGLPELLAALPEAKVPRPPRYSADLERALAAVEALLPQISGLGGLPPRHAAARLFSSEPLPEGTPAAVREEVARIREDLARCRGEDPALVLVDERHALAARLFREVARVEHARVGWRERLDDLLMHPLLAYPILALVLFLLFWLTFRVGSALEGLLSPALEGLSSAAARALGEGLLAQALAGALDGIWAGLAIALPYLLPFYLLLALLEDVGYLPRIGFLLDGLMHRLGLHGKSVIPFLLGYGCSVPAVLATRILEEERDRYVTAALAVLVPCAARTVVVFGLVGRFLGPAPALALYLGNILVIALAGRLLRRFLPGLGPGLILEIPPYRVPGVCTTLGKVWLRLREFLKVAWPILIGSSAVLALVEALGWEGGLNQAARFLTWPLGLPPESGIPLAFGVLRKELALIMLIQAFRTSDLGSVLTAGQMLVFTVFTMFYMPCLATLAALRRELGWRRALLVLLGTTGLALLLGLLARAVAVLV
ncbi:ferrous iron transport protein B [Candidatus Bipolaricaulota bacterium]|nr:ferrous iron transport protein B [Candidatus Bipolaricaulota bacterium]